MVWDSCRQAMPWAVRSFHEIVWRRLAGRCHRHQAARGDCCPEGWICTAMVFVLAKVSYRQQGATSTISQNGRHGGLFTTTSYRYMIMQPAVCVRCVTFTKRWSRELYWCQHRVNDSLTAGPSFTSNMLQNGPVRTAARRTRDCLTGQRLQPTGCEPPARPVFLCRHRLAVAWLMEHTIVAESAAFADG